MSHGTGKLPMFSLPRKSANPRRVEGDTRILLILDLDETLLFATDTPIGMEPVHRVFGYDIHWRPGLATFVQHVSRRFRLAVWTSSSGDYADAVCERIFPEISRLEFIWARDRCTRKFDHEIQEAYYAKHLRKLMSYGYELERVLVVDDSPEKHSRNYGNLIQVRSFEGDPNDDELVFLATYLEEFAVLPGDVRRPEKRGWRSRYAVGSPE